MLNFIMSFICLILPLIKKFMSEIDINIENNINYIDELIANIDK